LTELNSRRQQTWESAEKRGAQSKCSGTTTIRQSLSRASCRKAPRHIPSSDNASSERTTPPNFVALPYVKGVSEKIARVLRTNNVKVDFKPLNPLRTQFPSPKDKPSPEQTRCVVYKVSCLDCNFAYYGQSDRALATRIKEHQRAVRVADSNSKVAQHANQYGHNMDFNHAIIVDRAKDYHKRLFLEAWHSERDPNAGNERIEIPAIYKSFA